MIFRAIIFAIAASLNVVNAEQYPLCQVCGNGKVVGAPDVIPNLNSKWTCAELQQQGVDGGIPWFVCDYILELKIKIPECQCIPGTLPEPTTLKPTRKPTRKRTPMPTRKPTRKRTPAPTRKPTRKRTPMPTRKPTRKRTPTPMPTPLPTPMPTSIKPGPN